MKHVPITTYLRTHRRKSGLSQDEVAFLIGGVCGSQVARHERGGRIPVLATALAYEMVYALPLRRLYAGHFGPVMKKVVKRAVLLRRRLQYQKKKGVRWQHKVAFLGRIIAVASKESA